MSLIEIGTAIQAGDILQTDVILFPIGVISAAISGYLSIRFLMQFLQTHSTNIFVFYRWALALFIIIVALSRR